MQLTINGELHDSSATTVAELIAALQIDMRLAAVEKNRTIVSRSAYGSTPLAPGDSLEFVAFIGGG